MASLYMYTVADSLGEVRGFSKTYKRGLGGGRGVVILKNHRPPMLFSQHLSWSLLAFLSALSHFGLDDIYEKRMKIRL